MASLKIFACMLLSVISCALSAATVADLSVEFQGRRVFRRMESPAVVMCVATNSRAQSLTDLRVSAMINTHNLPVTLSANEIASTDSLTVAIPVDTALKPDVYELKLDLTGMAGEEKIVCETNITIVIVARPLPDVMPAVLWGAYGWTIERLKAAGFTHCFFTSHLFRWVWDAGKPVSHMPDKTMAVLDDLLANGLTGIATVSPGYYPVRTEKLKPLYQRINRDGEPYRRANVCGLFPEVREFCYNTGASLALTCGAHPAFQGADINNEIRDDTELCFHEHDIEAYRRFAGREIPPEAVNKGGLGRKTGPSFVPASGIVPDDDPILHFYRWFWKEGDGWNILNTEVNNGLKATGVVPDFWTFMDPAVRAPPLWGSGGDMDVISHWTYSYPDPPRIALMTDELFAMAAGRPGQRVMKMTQAIWYRRSTAPDLPEKMQDRKDWEKAEPDARFITIAPDHLREAFWLKISRPVQGIMHYGIGALWPGGTDMRLTQPDTIKVLTELLHNVVKPLGPTLMQVTSAPSDVAMLESFTTGVFGGEWTFGWARGWAGWAHLMLQWARLQPQVVYEETILRDDLAGIRVLVLPDCRVLPHGVFEKIKAFQRRGGIVVADSNLAPALTPDILIPASSPRGAPDRNKAGLQAMAEQLRADLAPVYDWYADSSDPDVIVYRRAYKDTDYLFAINDKREYGDYVGHHRKVMEQGVPHSAMLSVDRAVGYVYDLVESRAVAMVAGDEKNDMIQERHFKGDNGGRLTTGSPSIICSSTQLEGEPVVSRPLPVFEPPRKISWPAELEPGGGRLYMITSRPVEAVRVEVAERQPDDRRVHLRVAVTDGVGAPVDAVVPVEVRIHDPAGQEAEFSGYYGARDGVQDIALDMAENDLRGTWTVKVRELATGKKTETSFEY